MKIVLASLPDRDRLVAEIWFGEEQLAELNQERGDTEVELFPRSDGAPWVLAYKDMTLALKMARERLVDGLHHE